MPVLGLSALTACSSDGSLMGTNLTTSSINNTQTAQKPAIDPMCVSLVSKIDSLRKDGITDRVAKAGAGKTKTVPVYRTSLARMAELDRTNALFQQRCSKLKPASSAAAAVAPPPPPPAPKTAAVTTAKKAVVKAATTKTVTKATVATKTPAVTSTTTTAVKTVAKAAATDAAKAAATDAAKKAATEAAAKATTAATTTP